MYSGKALRLDLGISLQPRLWPEELLVAPGSSANQTGPQSLLLPGVRIHAHLDTSPKFCLQRRRSQDTNPSLWLASRQSCLLRPDFWDYSEL